MATKSKKWIQKATQRMEAKGTKGSFSADAKKAHMSTKAYASKVMNNPKASSKMKKKANFVKNVVK